MLLLSKGTYDGDSETALERVCNSWSDSGTNVGYCDGPAAGALELAGNLPSLEDGYAHATINVDELDPNCELPGLVMNEAIQKKDGISIILNNSFGMLGINSVLILKKFTD